MKFKPRAQITEWHPVMTGLITPDHEHRLAATLPELEPHLARQLSQAQVTDEGSRFSLRFNCSSLEAHGITKRPDHTRLGDSERW